MDQIVSKPMVSVNVPEAVLVSLPGCVEIHPWIIPRPGLNYRPASAEYSPFTLDTDGSIRVFIGVDRVDPGLMLAILVDIRTVYGKFTV